MCISCTGNIEKGLNGKIRKNAASRQFFFKILISMIIILYWVGEEKL